MLELLLRGRIWIKLKAKRFSAPFSGHVTSTESTYCLRSFKAIEVSKADQNAPAAPATRAFQNLMQAARTSDGYEQILAV